MIKLVAFDLDGTIGDTIPLCVGAVRKAVNKYVPNEISDNDVLKTFGLDEEGMIKSIVGCNWESALDDFYVIYKQMHTMCPHPFNGIIELIVKLKEQSILIALVTGKGKRSCAITLHQFNMDSCFDAIKTGSSLKNTKSDNFRELLLDYDLKPHEMIYIGDTISDIVSCQDVDVKCLSAAWAKDYGNACELEFYNKGNVFYSTKMLEDYLCKTLRQ